MIAVEVSAFLHLWILEAMLMYICIPHHPIPDMPVCNLEETACA